MSESQTEYIQREVRKEVRPRLDFRRIIKTPSQPPVLLANKANLLQTRRINERRGLAPWYYRSDD